MLGSLEQRLVLVLSVQVDQCVPEIPDQPCRGGRLVHPYSVAALTLELASYDQPVVVNLQPRPGTPLSQLGSRREIEAPLYERAVLSLTHEIG